MSLVEFEKESFDGLNYIIKFGRQLMNKKE
jgi:hypothetical protein